MASFSAAQGIKLLDNPKYSDMSLKCSTKTLKVHRAVVCTASPFFATCMDSNFKEARSLSISMSENKPLILAMALLHSYSNEFSVSTVRKLWKEIAPTDQEHAKPVNECTAFIDLYELADRLLMTTLQMIAGQKLAEALETHRLALLSSNCSHDLAKILEHAYRKTAVSDEKLRVHLTYFALKAFRDGQGNRLISNTQPPLGVLKVLKENEPVALGVFKLSKGQCESLVSLQGSRKRGRLVEVGDYDWPASVR